MIKSVVFAVLISGIGCQRGFPGERRGRGCGVCDDFSGRRCHLPHHCDGFGLCRSFYLHLNAMRGEMHCRLNWALICHPEFTQGFKRIDV